MLIMDIDTAWRSASVKVKACKASVSVLKKQLRDWNGDKTVQALQEQANLLLVAAKKEKTEVAKERRKRQVATWRRVRVSSGREPKRAVANRTALEPLARLAQSIRSRERRPEYGPPSSISAKEVGCVLDAYERTCALTGHTSKDVKLTLVKERTGEPLSRDNAVCVTAAGPVIKQVSGAEWNWPASAGERIRAAQERVARLVL